MQSCRRGGAVADGSDDSGDDIADVDTVDACVTAVDASVDGDVPSDESAVGDGNRDGDGDGDSDEDNGDGDGDGEAASRDLALPAVQPTGVSESRSPTG